MKDGVLKLYHRLPVPVRSAVASLRGYQLRSWRYPKETEQLVEEALQRDYWSRDEWARWRDRRLALLLHRAATSVPHYRTQWEERRKNGDRASAEYLENWPILRKEELRRRPAAFLADGSRRSRMFHEHTSGTTGKPLDVWFSRETVAAWYAVFEARWRRWNGITWRDRWAILGGQLVAPVSQRRPPFWVWNAGLNQLYMSSYHLSPANIPFYLDAITRFRTKYLWGYTSSLVALAEGALRLKRADIRPVVAVTNAEPLYSHQRDLIARAFRCPVRETYGMTEIAAAASECAGGHMHLWPDVGMTEIVNEVGPVRDGMSGNMVCTGLMNLDMPLIRYAVGDRASLAPPGATCDCGRSLPMLGAIEGRSDDVLLTTDGRPVGRLDTVFKERLPIREAQIVQEARDHVRVLYVPDDGFTADSGETIIRRLKDRMGDIRVSLEACEEIPRSANGKFRAVINRMTQAEKENTD